MGLEDLPVQGPFPTPVLPTADRIEATGAGADGEQTGSASEAFPRSPPGRSAAPPPLALLFAWIAVAAAVVAAIATHPAAALFALALASVTLVCLRGRLWLSAATGTLLALAFAWCQVVTASQPLGIAVGAAGRASSAQGPPDLSLGTWGPAVLGAALLLATVPVAGFPGRRLR